MFLISWKIDVELPQEIGEHPADLLGAFEHGVIGLDGQRRVVGEVRQDCIDVLRVDGLEVAVGKRGKLLLVSGVVWVATVPPSGRAGLGDPNAAASPSAGTCRNRPVIRVAYL